MGVETWYKAGTVTVTNGSATVTGALTSWAGNIYAGDTFYGPNNVAMEIASVNSNTSITLVANYTGSTASGQAYRIAPMSVLRHLVSTLNAQIQAYITQITTGFAGFLTFSKALASDINGLVLQLAGSGRGRIVLPPNEEALALEASSNGSTWNRGLTIQGSGISVFGQAARIVNGSAAAPGIAFASDTDTGLYQPTANALGFAAGGSEVARLTSAGRLGIGTTAPATPVHVVGGSMTLQANAQSGQLVEVYSSASGVNPTLELYRGRGTMSAASAVQSGDFLGSVEFYGHTGSGFGLGARLYTRAQQNWTGVAQGTECLLTITPSGASSPSGALKITGEANFRIGTVGDPSVRLHVDGAVRVGSYTVATVPAASTAGAGSMIYVTNAANGAQFAFSDGVNWRRVQDRALLS